MGDSARHMPPQDQHQAAATYFSHIPKTAGTSFTVILDRFFPHEDIYKPQLWWEVGNVKKVREQHYQCFRGHFGVGAQILSQAPMKVLTILRDPVSLAHSTYQYVKRDNKARKHDYVTTHELSFEAFLSDPITNNLASDRLFKSISFALDLSECPDGLSIDPTNYRAFRKQWNQSRRGWSVAEQLSWVKDYLSGCFWVGLQEHFEVSLLMLCYQMTWPPIGPTTQLNRYNKPQEISPQARAMVKKLNPVDNEIYSWATAQFEQQVKAFCAHLGLQSFDAAKAEQLVDTNYQKNYLKKNKLSLTEGIRYNFSMPLLGSNWHRREILDSDGGTFRWTGPDQLTHIDFWLVPKRYRVQVTYINITDEQLLDNLTIQINDSKVDWTVEKCQNTGIILFFCEQGMTRDDGLLRLTLNTSELGTHASAFGSTDDRQVGIAIKQIEFEAVGV